MLTPRFSYLLLCLRDKDVVLLPAEASDEPPPPIPTPTLPPGPPVPPPSCHRPRQVPLRSPLGPSMAADGVGVRGHGGAGDGGGDVGGGTCYCACPCHCPVQIAAAVDAAADADAVPHGA